MWIQPTYRVLHNEATGTGDGQVLDLYGKYNKAVVQITGTMGIITFKGTVNGVDWVNLPCTSMTTGATTATATAVGVFHVPVMGLKYFKGEITTHGGGTDKISAVASISSQDLGLESV